MYKVMTKMPDFTKFILSTEARIMKKYLPRHLSRMAYGNDRALPFSFGARVPAAEIEDVDTSNLVTDSLTRSLLLTAYIRDAAMHDKFSVAATRFEQLAGDPSARKKLAKGTCPRAEYKNHDCEDEGCADAHRISGVDTLLNLPTGTSVHIKSDKGEVRASFSTGDLTASKGTLVIRKTSVPDALAKDWTKRIRKRAKGLVLSDILSRLPAFRVISVADGPMFVVVKYADPDLAWDDVRDEINEAILIANWNPDKKMA